MSDPHARCVHFGEPTGETVRCRQCSGHVQVKLFHCDVHGVCSLVRQVDLENGQPVACCCGRGDQREACPDYERPT